MAEEEKIDLNNLTQRELLIVVAKDVRKLQKQVDEVDTKQKEQALKINSLETRSTIWGGIAGVITAIGIVLIERWLG